MTIREKINDYASRIPYIGNALTTEINRQSITAGLTAIVIATAATGGCQEQQQPGPLLKVKEYIPEETIKAEEGKYSVRIGKIDAAYLVERLEDGTIRDRVIMSSPEAGQVIIEGQQGEGMRAVYINGKEFPAGSMTPSLLQGYRGKLSEARQQIANDGDFKTKRTLENALKSISP